MVLIRTRRPGKTLPLRFMILSCLMLLLCLSPLQPSSFVVESGRHFQNFCFFFFFFLVSLFQGVVGVFGSEGDFAFLSFSFSFTSFTSCILTGNVHPWGLRMCALAV